MRIPGRETGALGCVCVCGWVGGTQRVACVLQDVSILSGVNTCRQFEK